MISGEDLSLSQIYPFWAKAQELVVVVFMHPQAGGKRGTEGRMRMGRATLATSSASAGDNRVPTRMMFNVSARPLPSLKICAAHSGGLTCRPISGAPKSPAIPPQ